MHDLARHVYNGNRTEEELSNMTRGDILMAAKGSCESVLPPGSAWLVCTNTSSAFLHFNCHYLQNVSLNCVEN